MISTTLIDSAEGFLKIKDANTGNVLVEKKNAIHFGNLSAAVALSLAAYDSGHARYMVFGNGGTSVVSTGEISYRSPNVTTLRDENAALYNQTYSKDMSINDDDNNITVSLTNTNYADINFNATLAYGEPTGQDTTDTALNNDGDYVFDELGIETGGGLLITHVIFHPVQKALNRIFEIEYTIRIQMGSAE
jgi:hypothetical protein